MYLNRTVQIMDCFAPMLGGDGRHSQSIQHPNIPRVSAPLKIFQLFPRQQFRLDDEQLPQRTRQLAAQHATVNAHAESLSAKHRTKYQWSPVNRISMTKSESSELESTTNDEARMQAHQCPLSGSPRIPFSSPSFSSSNR